MVGQPGSNGGVHRGPDLKPRTLMKALILKALSDEGLVVVAHDETADESLVQRCRGCGERFTTTSKID